jgi:lipoprotein-releasing system permease protein
VLVRGVAPGSGAAHDLAKYLDRPEEISRLFTPQPAPVAGGSEVESSGDAPEGAQVLLPSLIIGRELQRTYGIFEGQAVALLSPQVSSSPFGLIPKFKRFLVAGSYNSGLVGYESGLAYASLEDAQRFFNLGGSVTGIELRVADVDRSREVTDRITTLLASEGQGFYAQDWTELNRPLIEALRLERRVYFIVLLLIVVMASFSIITTLIMVVLEKRKDIAILKTLGASTRAIGDIFRIQGAVIGLLGTTSGLILGFIGCIALREYGFPLDERIFQMSQVPVQMDPFNFMITGVAAFLICCVATIYPARRASALEPSEVLRYE